MRCTMRFATRLECRGFQRSTRMSFKQHLLAYLQSIAQREALGDRLKVHAGPKSSGVIVLEKILHPSSVLGLEDLTVLTVLQHGACIMQLRYHAPVGDTTPAYLHLGGPLMPKGMGRFEDRAELPAFRANATGRDLLSDAGFKQMHALIMKLVYPGGGWKRPLKVVAGIGLAVGVVYAMFALYASSVNSRLQLANMHAPAPTVLASSEDQLDQAELLLLRDVVKESGIPSSHPGAPFVVFSDPNCPSCISFEKSMKEANWPFNPLVVPVSFKPGSDAIVAGVLCAENPSKAWEDAVAGKTHPACDKGRIQAAKNNSTFIALRFANTPTFVSAGGKIFKGSTDVRELLKWAQANYPAGTQVPAMPLPSPAQLPSQPKK